MRPAQSLVNDAGYHPRDLIGRRGSINHSDATSFLLGDPQIAFSHSLMKHLALQIETIQFAGPPLSLQSDGDRDIQKHCEIRDDPAGCELIEATNDGGAELPTVPLIRQGRIRKAVAEHDGPFFHGGPNDVAQMLRTAGQVEEELTSAIHPAIADVQQDGADLLTDRRAAGLARFHDKISQRPEPLSEAPELSGLPTPFNAFEAQ
jgi:hypothetical protein